MIILFGGSFDPIHNGHLAAAKAAFDLFEPSQLRFVPCGQHAFSKNIEASPAERLAMLKLALEDQPSEFCIDDQEIKSSEVSYLIDTLKNSRASLTVPSTESLAFMMGEDAFHHLEKWKAWEHFLDYAHLIIVSRSTPLDLNCEFKKYVALHQTEDLNTLKNNSAGNIYFLKMPCVDISSTAIRTLLAVNKNPQDFLPEKVWAYIQEKKLYGEI